MQPDLCGDPLAMFLDPGIAALLLRNGAERAQERSFLAILGPEHIAFGPCRCCQRHRFHPNSSKNQYILILIIYMYIIYVYEIIRYYI